MRVTSRWVVRVASIAVMALAVGTVFAGQPRQAVPHGGGGAPRGAAPPRPVHPSHAAAPRGLVPAGGTAHGVAHYGYGGYGYGGYGYGYGYGGGWWGYPYWGGWSPYWSVGWYGGWGWPSYGWGYAPWYGPYDGTYVVRLEAPDPQTPATILTKFAPSNAEVLLDGVSVGYAKDYTGRWDSLKIPAGRHAITFRSAGYTTVVVDLDAGPGARYVFSDDLRPGEGEVRRSLPAPVPPASAQAVADVPRDESVSPVPSSAIVRGRLKVLAQPEDAAVYLDGEYLGLAGELARLHGAIPVATGSHRLEIVRPGYASASETIDVSETDTASVQVTLVKGP